ncbi:ORF111R [Scale drop disease virus]|uniref:ORF111R n=1 Tax=Scale drop disease virus TaxID=1697349 RepID=A0A0K1L6C2_9VIRU|nr:ORF111R [Scale drop disease virus]AKU37526.1 ORF111R [Scale drop disease virus]
MSCFKRHVCLNNCNDYDHTQHYKFKYSNSCLSNLLQSSFKFDKIKSVLCIGVETGAYETVLCDKLLDVPNPILTDIDPKHESVEKLSCLDAIAKYGHCVDALMFCFPYFAASGYDISGFNGKYIVFVGEMQYGGHTNPDELLESIEEKFDLTECVQLDYTLTALYCLEQFCVFTRYDDGELS